VFIVDHSAGFLLILLAFYRAQRAGFRKPLCDTARVKSAKVWIVRIGYGVTLLTVAWVLFALIHHDGLDRLVSVGREHLALVLALLLAYAGVCLMQALAWWQLMYRSDGQALAARSIGIFALTQLGKYLPGNVMHFVFRYALTRAGGAARSAVLAASALEPWLLLCAALGLLVIFGGADWPTQFGWPGWLAYLLPSLALLALALVIPWLARRLPGTGLRPLALLPALLLEAAFLLGSALLFAALLNLFVPEHAAPTGVVLGAAVLAWLAGFVTPGSPGGLGVREMVLSLALAGWIEPAAAVGAAAAFRVLTVGGDLLVFAGGGSWWLTHGRNELLSYRRFLNEDRA